MMDELEILRRHIDECAEPEPDLGAARARLERAVSMGAGPVHQERARRSRRLVLSLSGLGAVAAVVAVLAMLAAPVPSPVPRKAASAPRFPTELSVGAQLRLLSDRVVNLDIPTLGSDQLLFDESHLSVLADVNGQMLATIQLDVKKWSNATGQSCTSTMAQPAQFATHNDQAVWNEIGLLDAPSNQPVTGCLGQNDTGSESGDSLIGNSQLMNVAGLPTDPSVLAQELEAGTTGIPAIDNQISDGAENGSLAFQRAAVLLLGPTIGSTSQIESALYGALALLPGITSLGPTTTHDGQTGVGFAAGSQAGQSAIVVDPSTGHLLELRNLYDANAFGSMALQYMGNPGYVMEHLTSWGAQLQWLDPQAPSVVNSSDLPSDVPVCIFATVKTGMFEQAVALADQLRHQYGLGPGMNYGPGPPATIAPAEFLWTFSGRDQQFDEYLAPIEASGFFASINVI